MTRAFGLAVAFLVATVTIATAIFACCVALVLGSVLVVAGWVINGLKFIAGEHP